MFIILRPPPLEQKGGLERTEGPVAPRAEKSRIGVPRNFRRGAITQEASRSRDFESSLSSVILSVIFSTANSLDSYLTYPSLFLSFF